MQALAKPEVGDFLSKQCVAVYDRVGTFSVSVSSDGKTPSKNGGNVAAFFCTPSGYVIHAVAGPRTGEAFLAEAKWAVGVYSQILADRTYGQSGPEQSSRVATALRLAHSNALLALTQPDYSTPGVEFIRHQPSSDPKLKGLEDAGRKQREQVHRLLKTKAFEPLAVVGPEVYSHILGEKLSEEPVHLSGAPEARQAAGSGKNLVDFLTQRASSAPPNTAAEPPARSANGSGRSSTRPKR